MTITKAEACFLIMALLYVVAFCLTFAPVSWSERFKLAGHFFLALGLVQTQ